MRKINLFMVYLGLLGVPIILNADAHYTLFGHPLNSPIGIAACPLTETAESINAIANRGYDIITYKTIRSCAHDAYPPPRMVVVDPTARTKNDNGHMVYQKTNSFIDTKDNNISITNSCGIASKNPSETIQDIKKSNNLLLPGQLLIVSIYGSGTTKEELTKDFVKTAHIAVAGGAQVLEANFSCPNIPHIDMQQPYIYQDPALVHTICKAIQDEYPTIPLIIKVGVFQDFEIMKAVFCAAYHGGARGICGINTVPVCVVDADKKPVFGDQRTISGLSGAAIFEETLKFVKNGAAIIQDQKLDLKLFATGGVMQWQQFDQLFAAGADVVQCATGALWHDRLALDYHNNHTIQHESVEKYELIKNLFHIGAIKIENMLLKSGEISPIYFDMRVIISYPDILKTVVEHLNNMVLPYDFDVVCGVPYAAVPLATGLAIRGDYPLIMQRKEAKLHGTKKLIEGVYKKNSTCAVIEDVMTSGSSILETIKILEEHELTVRDIFVIIDREQNGINNVQKHGYCVHPLFTTTEILQVLLAEHTITHQQFAIIKQFCANNQINV